MLASLPNFTSHLSWTQQRVNKIQKKKKKGVTRCLLHRCKYNKKKKKKKSEEKEVCTDGLGGGSSKPVWDQADSSTGCLQAGTAARWQWSSPPRRTGCTRKWVARQGLSSSTGASSRAATQDSLEDTASCSLSLPAPEPPCSPCLYKKKRTKMTYVSSTDTVNSQPALDVLSPLMKV